MMKYIKILSAIIVSASFLFGCSGNSAPTANKDSSSNSANEPAASSGNAHFSCMIDGQTVSGGSIDAMQEFNTAFIVDVDQGKELMFYLTDAKNGQDASQPAHSLRFAVPDKTGSSSFGPDEDGWGIDVHILFDEGKTARYLSNSFTINVTSLTATRVTGTFSGKFELSLDYSRPKSAKNEIEITGGKFDIPFSTGNMRPT